MLNSSLTTQNHSKVNKLSSYRTCVSLLFWIEQRLAQAPSRQNANCIQLTDFYCWYYKLNFEINISIIIIIILIIWIKECRLYVQFYGIAVSCFLLTSMSAHIVRADFDSRAHTNSANRWWNALHSEHSVRFSIFGLMFYFIEKFWFGRAATVWLLYSIMHF